MTIRSTFVLKPKDGKRTAVIAADKTKRSMGLLVRRQKVTREMNLKQIFYDRGEKNTNIQKETYAVHDERHSVRRSVRV